jgi:hypothetical protein
MHAPSKQGLDVRSPKRQNAGIDRQPRNTVPSAQSLQGAIFQAELAAQFWKPHQFVAVHGNCSFRKGVAQRVLNAPLPIFVLGVLPG